MNQISDSIIKSIISKDLITSLIIYLLIPSFLIGGGYGLYKFIYLFPIIILLIILHAYLTRRVFKIETPIITKENIFFYILCLLSIVSLVKAHGMESYTEVVHIIIGLLIIIIFNQFLTSENILLKIIPPIKVVILILSIHGIIDFFIPGTKVTATFSNENNLAASLLILAPFLFSEIISRKYIKINTILLFLILVTISLAEARLGQLTFFLQFVLFIFLYLIQSRIKWKKQILVGIISIILILSPIVLYQISKESSGETLIEQLNRQGSSINIRIHMFNEGLRIFQESNYLGVGAGNIIISDVWKPDIEKKQSLHFFLLTLLVGYGFIPALLYIYMHIVLFKDYFLLQKKGLDSEGKRFFTNSLIIFLFSIIVLSVLVSTFIDFRPFYFAFGFYFVAIKIYLKRKESGSIQV
ncbi:O-antigen ligase family protein [Cytobacillus oceanisediminis]|uniref:O-antigen ligase-related domain-containing protein n=1 Tax=Cytobacillus oceanisediminis 2691 TaxID=1196031 RepID=A0A160MGA1_9BACI|nr:O-antigen ligase family protein [Cytobacillus oceanisediminis]AND42260.1 hypothetical protein A361_24955 [Cytobacillus oceanisediminis 2691]